MSIEKQAIRSRTSHEPVLESEHSDIAGPTVTMHARNLNNVSHLEWTQDGRLLASEHTTGRIMDVSEGGDMADAEPYAEGLHSAASIEPLPDGRILVTDTWGDRVVDITDGGKITEDEVFATGMENPYSLAHMRRDGETRLVVTEQDGRHRVVTDITQGGHISEYDRFLVGVKGSNVAPGITPLPSADWADRYDDDTPWQEQWHKYSSGHCDGWTTLGNGRAFVSSWKDGQILEFTDVDFDGEPVTYRELAKNGNLIAWDLGFVGGIEYDNGYVYGANPESGQVFRTDPDNPQSHRFNPPLVTGLTHPNCLRIGPNGETLYVCDQGDGVVWKITDF